MLPPVSVHDALARDELLMHEVGSGTRPSVVLLYTCTDEAVVVGRGQSPQKTVNMAACAEDNIPVIRRFSGGGTVFISPACLLFTLVFSPSKEVPRCDVRGAYCVTLMPVVHALCEAGFPATFHAPCDIALEGRKCAGNAQAQKKNAILVHGSFLVNENLARIARYISYPPEEPAYRAGRSHEEFLCNIGDYMSREALIELLCRTWGGGAKRGNE